MGLLSSLTLLDVSENDLLTLPDAVGKLTKLVRASANLQGQLSQAASFMIQYLHEISVMLFVHVKTMSCNACMCFYLPYNSQSLLIRLECASTKSLLTDNLAFSVFSSLLCYVAQRRLLLHPAFVAL